LHLAGYLHNAISLPAMSMDLASCHHSASTLQVGGYLPAPCWLPSFCQNLARCQLFASILLVAGDPQAFKQHLDGRQPSASV